MNEHYINIIMEEQDLADQLKPQLTPSTKVIDIPLQVFLTEHNLLNDLFSFDGGIVKEQV